MGSLLRWINSKIRVATIFLTASNLFDIHSRGTALHFDYFTYTQSCKVPTTSGNYDIEFRNPAECQLEEFLIGPLSVNELNRIKSLIDQIGETQTAEIVDSLNRLMIKANHLRNYLIEQIQNDSNYALLDSIR